MYTPQGGVLHLCLYIPNPDHKYMLTYNMPWRSECTDNSELSHVANHVDKF